MTMTSNAFIFQCSIQRSARAV